MQRPKHGGNLTWAAALAHCQPDQLLDFSASINPLGPPESALQLLSDNPEFLLRHYPDPSCLELRQALAHHHQLPLDWILPGNGAAELLTWVGRDFSENGLGCELLVPGFDDYFRAMKASGVPLSSKSVGSLFGQTLTPEWPGMTGHNRGCILNNPHNPSGLRLDESYIQQCLEHYPYVVIDEAFLDFLPPGSQNSSIALVEDYPNLVILRSLTKFFSLPGLRIGYAIAHPDILHRWQQWRDPWSVNRLAIAMGTVCIQDQAFQKRTWAWLPEARSQLFQSLQSLPYLEPVSGMANFLLVKSAVSVTQLQTQLLQKYRILIRDCLSFPELGDDYFRVAVLSQPQNERLVKALRQILAT